MKIRQIEYRPLSFFRQNPRNARTHSQKQIDQIADSIREFGPTNPILADAEGVIIAGHGRLDAAKKRGLKDFPVIILDGLTEKQKRRLALADNKIGLNSGWDRDKLAIELIELTLDSELTIPGFDPPEIDEIILSKDGPASDSQEAAPPEPPRSPVSLRGDYWTLGAHRLGCGDAKSEEDLDRLCQGDRPTMAFLDPPYGLKVKEIVGRGRTKHAAFVEGEDFSHKGLAEFFRTTILNAARVSADGAVHFVCMDWRHIAPLITVGQETYGDFLNVCVWVKSNGGQGSMYRSRHELVAVFRVGNARHRNNVELGKHGRNRTNVWEFAGVNTFRKGRMEELRIHPTVKPVPMIVEAIKDCTSPGDIVLDTFGGSGSTLIAALRCGRRARLLELDPGYVDATILRWQRETGSNAIHDETGLTFEALATKRRQA